ncbi:MAG: Nif3-like dinuclear metal center hexameric protein [Bacteroidetes bacterium]|nr:Nif3-like dinuclear metal center hexameric protein [Bacteroidota bacterium]
MKINDIVQFLESTAPLSLQESYDNAGLLTGSLSWDCTGIICTLDATEDVVLEAIKKKCNLIVAHHPIIFSGLKKLNGKNYVEKTIIAAIKNDIAIYAIHTNIDNVINGVNGKMAALLGLENLKVISPKENILKKIYTYIPTDKAEQVRNAIFAAGGGQIGNYNECSFNTLGTGTFKAGEFCNPYIGETGKLHHENEIKTEIIFPAYLENKIIAALKESHPYEEVAYDIVSLTNKYDNIGSGIIGTLSKEMDELSFLNQLKSVFNLSIIRHTKLLNRPINKIALCGGAGSFLISKLLNTDIQAFITSDLKYHEFFDANDKFILADIGHYESEQFTIDLLHDVLGQKFPNFAVLKTEVQTNPVNYY